MNFAEVREKYPQYNDLSDSQLANGLHKKFYSDLSFDDFASRVGYGAEKVEAPPKPVGLGQQVLGAFKEFGEAISGEDDLLFLERKEPETIGLSKHSKGYGVSGEWEPESKAVDHDRSFLGDVGSRLARGGVGLVEGIGGGMRMSDLDPTQDTGLIPRTGKAMTDWAQDLREDKDLLKPDIAEVSGEEGLVKRGFGGALESVPTSMLPLAAAYAGAKGGALAGTAIAPGPGTAIGAVVGGILAGGAALFGTFGLGEYQNSYDDAEAHLREQGLPEDEIRDKAGKHALISSTAEVGGEVAGDVAALTFFGAFGKHAIKQGVKQTLKQILKGPGFIKALAKSVPFEAGSEVGTAYAQTKSQQELGMTDMTPAEGMAEAIVPAIFLSLMFGSGIRGLQKVEAHKLYKSLNSKDSDERIQAVQNVASRLDKENAKIWTSTAKSLIESGQEIPLSQPIVDFAVSEQMPTEELDSESQGMKADIESGKLSTAQIQKLRKALPKDHILIAYLDQVLEEKTAKPTTPKAEEPISADFQARKRNQEEIEKVKAEEERVAGLSDEEREEEQYWKDAETDIKKQQEGSRFKDLQADIQKQTFQQPAEDVSRETAPVPEKTDVALEGAGATIEQPSPVETIEKKQAEEAQPEKIVQPAVSEKVKEWWEMTRDEWFNRKFTKLPKKVQGQIKKAEPGFANLEEIRKQTDDEHSRIIKEALSEGKPVPESVLADYPDLKAATSDRRTKQLKGLRIKEKRLSQRRVDEIRRKTISEMTEEERGIALKYHELTGLQSKRAYNESEKKSIQVSIDVDALKWVNDTFGHDEAGNDLLIAVGKALTQTDIDSYHISGDEFYLQSDSMENVDKAVEKAYAYLKDNPLDLKYPDGTKITYKAGFSYGTGKDVDSKEALKKAETELQKHKAERKLPERGAKPTRGLGERTERDEAGLERKDTGREVKPKKEQPSKVRTMRGYIKSVLHGINFLNYKGELKDLDVYDRKAIAKNSGTKIDLAVPMLIEENFLEPGTDVADYLEMLRTDSKRLLSRDRLTVDLSDKKAYQKSAEEKKFEKELAWEPEAPPEGKYVQINAEDLPMGKKLTLLEDKSPSGWDVYEVTEKDPFSITLKDGIEIELKPLDKVEVLKKDLPKLSEPTESIKKETKPETPEKKEVVKEAAQTKQVAEKKPPTDMFGQPVPTDMFGEAIPETKKTKQERKTKEKRPPTQAQKPLFGEDKAQIQPELPLTKKPSEKDTLKTVTAEMGKGLRYTVEMRVAESDEVVKVSQPADEALRDADERILSLKVLRDCL